MKNNLKIQLKDGRVIHLSVQSITFKQDLLAVKEHLEDQQLTLLKFEHNHIQTKLDVSNINHAVLISFDEKGAFVGVTVCHSPHQGGFIVANPNKLFLFGPVKEFNFELSAICKIMLE